MQATITIDMDNVAFENGGHDELARILRDLAKHVENGNDSRRLMDSNGNHVGAFEIAD